MFFLVPQLDDFLEKVITRRTDLNLPSQSYRLETALLTLCNNFERFPNVRSFSG